MNPPKILGREGGTWARERWCTSKSALLMMDVSHDRYLINTYIYIFKDLNETHEIPT